MGETSMQADSSPFCFSFLEQFYVNEIIQSQVRLELAVKGQ